jgi:hypothetical protein
VETPRGWVDPEDGFLCAGSSTGSIIALQNRHVLPRAD